MRRYEASGRTRVYGDLDICARLPRGRHIPVCGLRCIGRAGLARWSRIRRTRLESSHTRPFTLGAQCINGWAHIGRICEYLPTMNSSCGCSLCIPSAGCLLTQDSRKMRMGGQSTRKFYSNYCRFPEAQRSLRERSVPFALIVNTLRVARKAVILNPPAFQTNCDASMPVARCARWRKTHRDRALNCT